jgi:hypothetical protein
MANELTRAKSGSIVDSVSITQRGVEPCRNFVNGFCGRVERDCVSLSQGRCRATSRTGSYASRDRQFAKSIGRVSDRSIETPSRDGEATARSSYLERIEMKKIWDLLMVAFSWVAAMAAWFVSLFRFVFLFILIDGSQFSFASQHGTVQDSVFHDSVDLIELNHFHDCTGKHVYDQVIFYEWSIEALAYRVRAWVLVDENDVISRRPVRYYETEMYRVRWHDRDQNIVRCISSRHFRESWTQIDPERANKKIFDERQRVCLTKRTFDPALCQDTIEGCE